MVPVFHHHCSVRTLVIILIRGTRYSGTPELYENACTVADCENEVVTRWAECGWCWNVFCKKHDKVGFHLCRQWRYGPHNLEEKGEIELGLVKHIMVVS
ncbi:uncharacterized protein L199_003373 [Kwoniella botswanensis]|uniref:uncharacterized protein n=1 Tax=Kwoniella botswanensis TaxID=1268659 RepID=UPI00315D231C